MFLISSPRRLVVLSRDCKISSGCVPIPAILLKVAVLPPKSEMIPRAPHKPDSPCLAPFSPHRFVGFWDFLLAGGLSFSWLSSSDNNFKRGKAAGPRGVDQPKTNYGRVTCTVIYGCRLPSPLAPLSPYRRSLLFHAPRPLSRMRRAEPMNRREPAAIAIIVRSSVHFVECARRE